MISDLNRDRQCVLNYPAEAVMTWIDLIEILFTVNEKTCET